jgi:energy-coupling factor transporter ATP-binding protein EcfA2
VTASAGLSAQDVSFAYLGAARAALRHVDLAVAPGEVVLVTGASGCGKSTLALVLAGLIPSRVHGQLRGQVSFGDRVLSGLPPHEASQLVGLVFQNPNQQLINQTVQSEVAFGPENLALPQPEIAARVDWCLEVTGMAGMRHAAVLTLSGGQKQRTAIAATLAMRPAILVLDEPLSDLDPIGAQEVSSGLVEFRGQPIRPGKVFEHAAQVALLLQAADEMLFAETVRAELEFGTRFRALPPDPVLDVAGAIEFFGFADQEDASPWELSQGGRQRLALAALLVGAPGVLVLDEPTTGQDADHMRAFLRLLERVRKHTGLTVITVTHDIRGLASRAARVIVLGEGKIRLDGPARQIFARTGELARWGVLAPPLARLQVGLLGDDCGEVLLTVDELAAAARAHAESRPGAAAAEAIWS